MGAACKVLLVLALAVGPARSVCQTLHYVEPGVASCPAPPAPAAAAKTVTRGIPVSGSIHVACGFEQGSYTVILNSTDPGATFSPRTFLVNFGRIVGNGAFAVTFSTLGMQRISAGISANMGSPAVRGHFASAVTEFNVVNP